MIPFILLSVGILLIFIEIFMPGLIMGVIGLAFIIASFYMFAQSSDSHLKTALFMAFGISALIFMVRKTLFTLAKSRDEKGFTLHGDQEGFVASVYDKNQIGNKATVLTDLKPGGRIAISGKSYQAISISGYIPAGETVLVVRGEGESLIVRKELSDYER